MQASHRRYALVTLLVLLVAAGTSSMSAATRCVNPYGTNGCFTTITAAIAAAVSGDSIRIAAGRYVENVVVNKPVTIFGAGDRTVIVPAISAPDPIGCGASLCGLGESNIILVQANNVTIHDLLLNGNNKNLTSTVVRYGEDIDARNGIITNHPLGKFDNLTVYNVTVQNIFLRGMYASSGGTFNFHDNEVCNVQGGPSSIAMFNFGGSGRFVRNKVRKANDAISSNHSAGVQFLDNEVSESLSGVHTDNAGDGGGTSDLIRGNKICDGAQGGAYGVFVFVPYLPVTVDNNDISNVEVGLAAYGSGLNPAAPVTFTNNDVDGRKTANSVGMLITTDFVGFFTEGDVNVTMTKNNFADFEAGVMIQGAALNNVSVNATCNAIEKSTKFGIVSGDLSPEAVALSANYPGLPTPGGAALTNVNFAKNTIDGKKVGADNRGTTVLNAANNYWGCAQGPLNSKCDSTVGLVQFTPWLTKPASCVRSPAKHD